MTALIQLTDVTREFQAHDNVVVAINGLTMSIESGEMVAIMGPSGSGKSTLMNILGCLDQPSLGVYEVNGQDVGRMSADDLASLRREYFGFVFQRYQLLGALTAISNVEIPGIYAGIPAARRRERARMLLERLGIGDRLHHLPSQLSGGQQQRVSIARALMNGGDVILADEPTGALDRSSGQEVMSILKELHRQGHTVIVVTHDPGIAAHAQRVIELSDGRIVRDDCSIEVIKAANLSGFVVGAQSTLRQHFDRILAALWMALSAMAKHRLRTVLTMLGISIGIASVVSVLALGAGTRERILSDIGGLGTNTIEVLPGSGFGDPRASAIQTLCVADADALAKLDYVDSATPTVGVSVTLRRDNLTVKGSVTGVGAEFFRVRGYTFSSGQAFGAPAVAEHSQEAVIDNNALRTLFPGGENPLGQTILLGSVPVRIVGVTDKRASAFGNDDALNVWIPYSTATARLLGEDKLRSISVRVSDSAPMSAAEQGIIQLLSARHGSVDFFLLNTDAIRQTVERTTQTITLMISSIALISLIVGGIGVMNMMLVTVGERTPEIGIRMAVGARQSDILSQFLIEAILVCFLGGTLGVTLALSAGSLFNHFATNFHVPFSFTTIASAFGVSTAIGTIFGFLPARNAAVLNPVAALAHE